MAENTPPHARDQQLGVMLTRPEKDAVERVAREMGMSLSTAGRYLIRQGLAARSITFNDEGE